MPLGDDTALAAAALEVAIDPGRRGAMGVAAWRAARDFVGVLAALSA